VITLNKKVLINLSLDEKEVNQDLTDQIAGGSVTWFCSVWQCQSTGCECPNPEILN